MKNPFSKKVAAPAEFSSQEPARFIVVYRQTAEDFDTLRRETFEQMRPLQRIGARYLPWVNLLALPWIFQQIQRFGWSRAALDHSWLSLLMLGALGYFLYDRRRGKKNFERFARLYPYRAFVAFSYGYILLASDEKAQVLDPPILLHRALWREIGIYRNTPEHAILLNRRFAGILVSNQIIACSCEIARASQMLDELLAPSIPSGPPIAEPR